MNPELYERYLQKKAKKLGISVDELKAQNSSSSTSQADTTEPVRETVQEKPVVSPYIFGPSKINETVPHAQPEITEPTDTRENKFALIGYPLGHSLSKIIHEAGFKSLGVTGTYDILETTPDNLVDRIKYLKSNNYKGFNVTIPLKLPISLFVNEVDRYADLARAINTIYIEKDKTLKGYNTDVIGFRRAIPSDINLRGAHAGILGTGGAAHAACVALSEIGVGKIDFFTRNIPNSIDLMAYLRRKFENITFNVYQIENIRDLSEYDIMVNATPIGMLGKSGDMMPLEEKAINTLKSDAIVYDVIYNPKKTRLIKACEKRNLRTITGLDMLIYQAVSAQEKWFGNTPDFKDMKIAALEAM